MKTTKKITEYGFVTSNDDAKINIKKGQYVSGFSVGILCLDECWYPVIPGNVANLSTYDFPVLTKVVPNCTQKRIHVGDPTLVNDIIASAIQLEREGAKAICGACGFFGNYQKEIAEAVNIPVFLSSLVQVPWIETGLKSNQKIGILTADKKGITKNLLFNCNVVNYDNIVIKDLRELTELSGIVDSRGNFDNETMKEEIIQATIELLAENTDLGAILLECSDLPPYASLIQHTAGLPVFDFITMIKWVHMATAQKPYTGFV